MYWRLLTSRQHGYYYFHWLSSWTSMPLLSTGVRDVKLVGILQSRKTVDFHRRQRCLISSHPSVSEDRGILAALDSSVYTAVSAGVGKTHTRVASLLHLLLLQVVSSVSTAQCASSVLASPRSSASFCSSSLDTFV